jgi:DNA polymerase-3 subunit delta
MAEKKVAIQHYEFLRTAATGKQQPVYLILGDESFLKERIIAALVKRFLTAEGREFDFVTIYGDETSGSEIVENADSMPFISDYRIVIVRDFEMLKQSDQDALLPYLSSPSETTILIIASEKMDARTKLYKAFLEAGPVIQCKSPYNAEALSRWIRDELRIRNIQIDNAALGYLSSHIKLDYFTANNEIEKLVLYIGAAKTISRKHVEECVAVTNESSVFDLQNAIGLRDKATALKVLESMTDFKDIDVMMITLLSRYFQLLWRIHLLRARDISDSEIVNTHLDEVYKTFRQGYITSANKYSVKEIKKAISLLYHCDKDLKSLNTDSRVIITKLIFEIC